MAQDQKNRPAQPSEQGDDIEARRKEPYGPGQYRSGMNEPGEPTKKNPGHTNPAHNTPGHDRGETKRQEPRQERLAKSQEYPGLVGQKTRALKEEKKAPTVGAADKHPETVPPRRTKPS